jgi:hypothetical protein
MDTKLNGPQLKFAEGLATRILGDMSEAVATITGGQPDSAIMASRGNWIAAATPLSTPPLSDAETFQFPGCFLPVSIPALWFPPCFPGCFQECQGVSKFSGISMETWKLIPSREGSSCRWLV